MCKFDKYGSFRIDPCLFNEINELNKGLKPIGSKTIASCCGHGKYAKTILIQTIHGSIIEYYSGTTITENPRKSNRYYKRDEEGVFYLPELQPIPINIEVHEGVKYDPIES